MLQLGLGAGAAWLAGCTPRAPPPAVRARPALNVVLIHLGGGIDAVYTTDPKRRAEVEPNVDVPYEAQQIVDTRGFPLGPHLAALRPLADRLTILNGVQVHTAGHYYGTDQYLRLRTNVHQRMPTVLDLLGAHRDAQPLGTMSWWDSFGNGYSPASFRADTLLAQLDRLTSAELGTLAAGLRGQAAGLDRAGRSPRVAFTAGNIRDSAALLEALRVAPRFAEEEWSPDEKEQAIALRLQRVLWALENGLTRSVLFGLYRWDSHQFNAEIQTSASSRFFRAYARFLDELTRRRDEHGTLAERTLVVVGSELGRYPVMNVTQGKDHFPEIPLILSGPGLRPGLFGATGRRMEALPLDLRSGRPQRGGRPMQLDQVGATILRLAGLEPSTYGYHAETLDFLRA